MNTYRNNGAIGALLDEYEKAIAELKDTISSISEETLIAIIDKENPNPTCKSIQTILTHVARAGYWYAIEIRKTQGEELGFPEERTFQTVKAYQEELTRMFQYTEAVFEQYPTIDIGKQRTFRWQHIYNIDLLLEHAIVHILRHRRQISRYLMF